ncbi:DUF523 domain-containing protein [Catenulispora sp. NL8]|uniref:DUF523 domain-containing protein n=1 Tax=Catenulispora pinistramenti TaxID=2705254 RepID=A0ABS5L8P2_9ACTN|nr:DUF523 domain-containing protein [Catenulispora pinistramenti]
MGPRLRGRTCGTRHRPGRSRREAAGGAPSRRAPNRPAACRRHDRPRRSSAATGTTSSTAPPHIVTADGEDVTAAFVAGAEAVAKFAADHGIARAVLQDRSPSCGCGRIYDGTHTGELVDGDGVLAALLKRQGVEVTATSPRRL